MNFAIVKYIIASALAIGAVSLFFVFSDKEFVSYVAYSRPFEVKSLLDKSDKNEYQVFNVPEKKVTHLKTPEPVRAIYMTSWVAGDRDWRQHLVNFIESSEVNALVIDVKDSTGRVSFKTTDPYIWAMGSSQNRILDIKDFIRTLHKKNIYTIARISVFQDPYFVSKRPDLAVKTKSGAVWNDRKGLPWIDPAAKEFWDYIVLIAKEAEKVGFDELNFDYIRFPSDGDMFDIAYDHWDEETPPAEVIRDFSRYLRVNLDEIGIPLSIDLFGLVTLHTGDLNIGQILEYVEPYFDYLSPMVYPSHYPVGFRGYQNPALHPYEIIYEAMTVASRRLLAASSTPSKLRPWIQDFDLGAIYDAEMIRKEKQAIYDAGLTSWMAWNAANRYTQEAYGKVE